MKPSEQRLSEARRHHTEAIVARHVHELFKRLPMLSGFGLRPDLKVAEPSVFTSPGYTAGQDLYEEVMQSLIELAEERPEAVQLMRGRTSVQCARSSLHPSPASSIPIQCRCQRTSFSASECVYTSLPTRRRSTRLADWFRPNSPSRLAVGVAGALQQIEATHAADESVNCPAADAAAERY